MSNEKYSPSRPTEDSFGDLVCATSPSNSPSHFHRDIIISLDQKLRDKTNGKLINEFFKAKKCQKNKLIPPPPPPSTSLRNSQKQLKLNLTTNLDIKSSSMTSSTATENRPFTFLSNLISIAGNICEKAVRNDICLGDTFVNAVPPPPPPPPLSAIVSSKLRALNPPHSLLSLYSNKQSTMKTDNSQTNTHANNHYNNCVNDDVEHNTVNNNNNDDDAISENIKSRQISHQKKHKQKEKLERKTRKCEFVSSGEWMERLALQVKLTLKPSYSTRKISKAAYKEIMRKAVNKIYASKVDRVDSEKIDKLTRAYIEKYATATKKRRDRMMMQQPKLEHVDEYDTDGDIDGDKKKKILTAMENTKETENRQNETFDELDMTQDEEVENDDDMDLSDG